MGGLYLEERIENSQSDDGEKAYTVADTPQPPPPPH